ncbi:MAG: NUDIX hydrolase [Clostridia bacterium]|nr:NUDIX hydrolase [Clostridia bacterium]
MPQNSTQREENFLSEYNINDYDRPSVATDIAAFAIYEKAEECYRKNPELALSVLLIKRGEPPFRDHWALPGGFLEATETVEECAFREILEETGISPVSLMPIGTFSAPERDPRGRIVSLAYTSVLSEGRLAVHGGHDASDASWFDVRLQREENGTYSLLLENGTESLFATLRKTKTVFRKTDFEIISNEGLAFDHAAIIAAALSLLKKEAKYFDILFDFLPEKFTLTSLQRTQEILTGTSLLSANFRRKVSEFVEETDEYTEGAGHRPARLFRKKQFNI